jgi:hypothetical protein
MKKLLIIFLIFTAFTSSAQVYQRDPSYGRSIDRYEVLKDLGIPTFCGTPTVNSTVTDKAKIAFDSCGHKFYIYDPSNATWGQVTGGGVIIEPGVDSITYHDNQLCQWVDGVSTCYFLNKFYDSSALNYNQTKIIHFNTGHPVDSVSLPTNNLNLYWPLYGDNADTSVHFKNDSLPRLDYATAVRDTSEWNDNTLIDKLFLHDRLAEVTATGITRTELQDTASAIRSSMGSGSVQSVTGSPSGLVDNTDPANPVIQQDASKVNISDTAAMLSHYLLDAIAGTNVTIDKTNPQKPVINSSGGKDSSAYHTVQSIGDTALVICDLQGRCDTTFFSAHTVWSKNGNYAYYNSGNVGIKDMTPPSLLTLTNATTNNTPEDSLGVLLRTSTDATSGNPTVSLPIILAAKAWVTASSQSQNIKFKMYARGNNGTASGNMYIDFSGNDGAYSNIITIGQNGNLTTNALSTGVVTGTSFSGSSFTASRNVNNGSSFTDNTSFIAPASLTTYRSFYYNPTWTTSSIVGIDVRAFDNTIGNNVFNRVRGSTSIGSDSVVTGAKLAVTSTTSAFLLPRMTKVQRDSIYSGFTGSITNPGTGGTAANNTYLRALTGGSGTGAEAAITIVSNQVTAVTITKYGSGYAVGDVLTAAVGGIIGWTWTISFIIPPKAGSVIYQTDNTPGIRVFNGTNWMKFTETAD